MASAGCSWAGASLSAEAGAERTVLRLSGPSQSAPSLLSLLGDVAQRPAFAPDRIGRILFQDSALESQRNGSI